MAGMMIRVQAGKESLVAHLGPRWFLTEKGVSLATGDEVQLTGSRVTMDGAPALIVRQLRKGGTTIDLRNRVGVPMWGPARTR